MPRDQRLYITLPLDFDEHPKVVPLSDSAAWTFVCMNLYSRRNDLDGAIPAVVARKKWKPRVLTELVQSHPERPLVLLDGDTYLIRDYAEHQFTTSDLADLREKRSQAGAKGAAAKAATRAKQTGSKTQASAEQKGKQKQARVQSSEFREIQDLTGRPNLSSDTAQDDTGLLPSLKSIIATVRDQLGLTIDGLAAGIIQDFLDTRRGPNADPLHVPERYYRQAIAGSPYEVSQFIHTNQLES